MSKIQVSQLKRHPHNNRVVIDHEILAGLVCQIASRGLDVDRYPVVDQNNIIIRGHLRTLAFAIVQDHWKAAEPPNQEEALVIVQELAAGDGREVEVRACYLCGEELTDYLEDADDIAEAWDWCEECGEIDADQVKIEQRLLDPVDGRNIIESYDALLADCIAEISVLPFVFEDDRLAYEYLLGDQFNTQNLSRGEILATAKTASEMGVERKEYARITGQSPRQVAGLFSLLALGEEVAALFVKRELPWPVASSIVKVDAGPARNAILSRLSRANWVRQADVDRWCKNVRDWQAVRDAPVSQPPLEPLLPETVNSRLLDEYSWQLASQRNAEVAWMLIAANAYNMMQELKKLADLDAHPLEAIRCEHCVLHDLLLATPFLPTRVAYPCQRVKDWDKGCTLCVCQGEPFFVHGFFNEPPLLHLTEVEGCRGWTSEEEFKEAIQVWIAQGIAEDAEWEPRVAAVTVQVQKEEKEDGRPVDEMRLAIGNYQLTHVNCNAVSHSWACRCVNCEWDTAPEIVEYEVEGKKISLSCQWAKRRRTLSFSQLVSGALDGIHKVIPYCNQYSPQEKQWQAILASLQQNVLWPRPVLLRACEQVHWRVKGGVSISNAILLHLTGRPMSNSAPFRNWYTLQFDEQIGELSDLHLSVLLEWLLAKWGMTRSYYTLAEPQYCGYLANREGLYEPWWMMSYAQEEGAGAETKEEEKEDDAA